MIRNKKAFALATLLLASFFGVLAVMFSPVFHGENAFHASDRLFNTISKGSIYHIPQLMKKVKMLGSKQVSLAIRVAPDRLQNNVIQVFTTHGVKVDQEKESLKIQGDLSRILAAALKDSDAMYYNRGDEVRSRYGIPEKEVLFAWWTALREMDRALKMQKQFKEAKLVHTVIAKGVEVGYNYYGIAPENAKSRAGILAFALAFYVVYTLWFGYGILFMFEGFGLRMTKGVRKEV